MTGKPLRRSSLTVRAEVDYVNAEEAKKLIAAEGYAVLDVRDRTQFERAHIKDCYHVPLFIENNDNDLGKFCFSMFVLSFFFSSSSKICSLVLYVVQEQ